MSEILVDAAFDLGVACQRIEDVVRSGGRGLQAGLTTVLHELGQPDAVRTLLRSLLADEHALEQVARRSFLHRNGFLKKAEEG